MNASRTWSQVEGENKEENSPNPKPRTGIDSMLAINIGK
jgi:hypothetical protein